MSDLAVFRWQPFSLCPAAAGFVASISWVASYLSLAASACSDAVNSGALCAADWTALMADMSEIASSGAGVKRHCDYKGQIAGLLALNETVKLKPWQRLISATSGPAKTILKVTMKRHVSQLEVCCTLVLH